MDLIKSFSHPNEILALVKFKLFGCDVINSKLPENLNEDAKACYKFLKLTSRSFSMVIQALDQELRHAVCIFYLVLRALDTVEDDMTISESTKISMLNNFYTYLEQENWKFMESCEKDKIVLENFPMISSEFRKLDESYKSIISEICHMMGKGMILYLSKSPGSLKDWNEYCHYVAGLVGIGLSKLFSASQLESSYIGKDEQLSNSMGLFLQKTNIIRDYLEDINDNREFWPREVWGKYVTKLKDFKKPDLRKEALLCLNELICNTLEHVPDVLRYLSHLQNQSVFNFCAIPQVMAIATLERCYNNYNVFTGIVKIRKGETVQMMSKATSFENVKAIFTHFSLNIKKKIPNDAPPVMYAVVQTALSKCETKIAFVDNSVFLPVYICFLLLLTAIMWQYFIGFKFLFLN